MNRAALVALVLASLIGGAARLSTITWGSPFLLHPDERGFVMWEAASIEWRGLVQGDWRPRTTTYGPLIYELALGLKWAFLGGIDEAREEARRYPNDWAYVSAGLDAWADGEPFSFLRWTHLVRGACALASALAILLLGSAAWLLGGARAGVMTGWLAASSAGLIQASHFATTDGLLLVWIAMLLHATAWLARGGRLGVAAYAGVALGLIAATKLTGLLLLVLVPFGIAASGGGFVRRIPAGCFHLGPLAAIATRRFVVAVLTMLALYALLCPWALFEPAAYFDVPGNRSGREVLLTQYTESDYVFWDWRFNYNGTAPFLYLLTHVLPYALGVPVLLAAAAEMTRWWPRARFPARIALVAVVPTFLLVGPWGVKTIRYALPMVPALLLAAGVWCARSMGRGAWMRALAAVVLVASLARGAAFTGMFMQDDPRVLAGRWVLDHVEAGDVVVVGPEASYTAPLGTNDGGIGVEREPPPGLRIRRLWRDRPNDVRAHVDANLQGARFVVVGELYRRRGMHPEAHWRAPDQARFYRALFAEETGFERVATFARAPSLGPLRWDESDAEVFAVAFDHMPVYVFERKGRYRSPFEARVSRR